MRTITSLLIATALISACAAPKKADPESPAPTTTGSDWSVDAIARKLSEQSCRSGTKYLPLQRIAVKARPVEFGPAAELARRLPHGVTFAGGWSLTSDNPAFGGLSGLAVTKSGNLLSVADVGEFVWLGLKDGQPDGTGKLAYMLGAQGEQLHGKKLGDSEGLAIRGDLALVSFERTHRISAFALPSCGANAREALIADLPPGFDGHKIEENLGAEALAVSPSGRIRFGIEHLDDGRSPIGMVAGKDKAGWTGELAHDPKGYSMVGMDQIQVNGRTQTYELFRDWDPVRGSRNVIRWGDHQFTITAPLTPRDNFEGIAAQKLDNGHVRLWIVADDNFSDRQQNLLYVFDIAPKAQ